MKVAWTNDTHFNFLAFDARKVFYQELATADAEAVMISGDIAEAGSLTEVLKELTQYVAKPIYFVLGNHDYYYSSVLEVREEVTALCEREPLLHWLPLAKVLPLGRDTVLVGEDCWADGRDGNYADSHVRLSDSRLIQELHESSRLGRFRLLDTMQQLADADARRLHQHLQKAIDQHAPLRVIVLTHIPPFKESCLHEGKAIDEDNLPFFSSKVTGDMLLEFAKTHPNVEFLVLCGHTHSSALYQPLSNLTVQVGQVEYRKPLIQNIFTI